MVFFCVLLLISCDCTGIVAVMSLRNPLEHSSNIAIIRSDMQRAKLDYARYFINISAQHSRPYSLEKDCMKLCVECVMLLTPYILYRNIFVCFGYVGVCHT